MSTPTLDQLKHAVQISEQIDSLRAELDAIFGGNGKVTAAADGPAAKAEPVKSGKRTMSPEARERIAAAQRARWAKSKGATTASAKPAEIKTAEPAKKAKRTMSPEARAKIAAAARKRWAGIKGEKPAAAVETKASKPAKNTKRNISPEGRAKMAAAAKRRWAGVKKS